MKGRKPKPTKLKILRGNPGRRRINQAEPLPGGSVGDPPAWLSAAAKREWRRIRPELERAGLATAADRAALAAYCQACAELEDATRQLNKSGRVVLKRNGPAAHPAVARQRAAQAALRAWAAEFGLTPSARARIQLDEGASGDELGKFLGGQVS